MSQGIAVKNQHGINAGLPRSTGHVLLSHAIAVRVCDGETCRTMRAGDFNRQAATPGTWECEKVLPIMDELDLVIRT